MSTAKARGTAFESAVVRHLIERGWVNAERRALRGTKDAGDLAGIIGLAASFKAVRAWRVADWLDELTKQRANAGAEHAVLVVKRWRKPIGRSIAMLDLDDYLRLLKEAGY
jgi:hypothetical protein